MTNGAERRRAARALVARPIIDGDDGADLELVRRHRADLSTFFSEQLGYTLDATRPGLVRLAKAMGPAHEPRGLHTKSGRPFDPRRYALVCLVLAALEEAADRTTARRLFDEVVSRANTIDQLSFSSDAAADRRAFIQAVHAVTALGVVELAEGDEEAFVRGDSTGDALYRIDRDRLGLLPAVTRPPSLSPDAATMLTEHYADTDDGRARRRRHRVMRALVEQPVVYRDDLDDDDITYLHSQRATIERHLDQWLGLDLEVREEGWLAVDPDGELTDDPWPDYGAANVAALRLADELARRHRDGEPGPWPLDGVATFVAALAADYDGAWRKDGATPEGAAALTADAVAVLRRYRLAVVTDAGLEARPAVARFALARFIAEPTTSSPEPT